jgi:ABC-2 type transport system permease protein
VFVHHALYIACYNTFPCTEGWIRPGRQSDFYGLLLVTQEFVVIMWVLAVVLLGMGGIVREKALGTSSLTLSLPVSRARLMRVRVGLGILEALALAVLPWATVFAVSWVARMPVLITQVSLYVLLLVGGGLVYFAMAVLVSSVVAGEYTAPALAFGVVLLAAIMFDAWLRRFNVWRLVTGDYSIDRDTYLLSSHLPWWGILASLFVAALMLLASTLVVQRRDF